MVNVAIIFCVSWE